MQNNPMISVVWPAIKDKRNALILACAMVSLATLLDLVPHLVVYLAAIQLFSPEVHLSRLYGLAAIAFVTAILRLFLYGGGLKITHGIAFTMTKRLKLTMVAKLRRMDGSFFADQPSGAIKKTVVDDTSRLENLVAHSIPDMTAALLSPVAAFLMLAWVNWKMALLSIAIAPLALLAYRFFMRDAQNEWDRWHAVEARANSAILEFIRGVPVLKAFDRDADSLDRVRDGVFGIRDLACDMTRRTMGGWALVFTLFMGNLLVVLPAGVALLVMGHATPEQLILFVLVGSGILQPLLKLTFLFGNLQHNTASIARIHHLLKAPELSQPSSTKAPDPGASMVFDKLSFTYPGRNTPAVKNIDFELKPGTITALVGASGAGKTTLARLAVREYDPSEGQIRIGEQSLSALSAEDRQRSIAHVAQGTTLFDASVADNLRLAKPDATIDELRRVAEAAEALSFIEAMPGGFDSPLGDTGRQLSGGERQRLAIARALLKDAPFVVLDEVTANVDPESERGIHAGLAALAKDRAILVVAHRLRTIMEADQILVMEGGEITGRGRHEALLQSNPTYQELWTDQEAASRWTLGG